MPARELTLGEEQARYLIPARKIGETYYPARVVNDMG